MGNGRVMWSTGLLAGLYLLVLVLAVMMVNNRHQARHLFLELQQVERERDVLNAEWSRLRLEKSALLNDVHVERQAKRVLGMQRPQAGNIRIIRE